MIRVGILGCAAIARRSLAPAFVANDNFTLTCIASRSNEKATEFAAPLCARPCSYDELITDPEIDLIYCPLPTGLHYSWVKRGLLANKHILCEKSLACNVEEVEELVELARQRKRLLMESFQFRFHPQNVFVKKVLLENGIGQIRQCVIRFGVPPFQDGMRNIRYSRELGGGALLDNGAYIAKCATYLFGGDVRVLAATQGKFDVGNGDVDIWGAVMMEARGVPIQAAYGFDHLYRNGYDIWGTAGIIKTTRAFTARSDFPAPVVIEKVEGMTSQTFQADHFDLLLNHIAGLIEADDFTAEYDECLVQARILSEIRRMVL